LNLCGKLTEIFGYMYTEVWERA